MTSSIVPIQKIGSYFKIDSYGYVLNPASREKIQSDWKPLIDEVVEVYKRHSGDTLHSVYIRGSVARGEAIDGISDIDSFAYTTQESELDNTWTKEEEKLLLNKFPFAQGIEFSLDPLKFAEEDQIMLAQSLCLYGPDLTNELPKFKPGKQMVVHVLTLSARLDWFEKRLEKIETEEDIKKSCLWLMKTFLRSGFELTMPLSGTYTRDLYPCYETFAKYYPERAPQMHEFLRLALNPVADKESLREMTKEFGGWLQEEAKRVYP